MATAVANEPKTETCGLGLKDAGPAAPPLSVTPRAAEEVKRHVAEVAAGGNVEGDGKLYLRVRVQGGGCSGFQNKLDLDPKFDEKTDHKFEFHGIEVVVDKRSLLYLNGAIVDFHDDLNKRGFTVTNPQAKGTCGCGSSYSM
jgi:iron-sulfur cluster assembly accessory protein